MGSSAQADLVYGYVFNKECYPWEDEDDYDSIQRFKDMDWDEEHFYMHLARGKSVQEVEKMAWEGRSELYRQCPVDVMPWGYLDCREVQYLIHPRDAGARHTCYWDSTIRINTLVLNVDPQWNVDLAEYVKDMGIDVGGAEPGWNLVASYG